MEQDNGDDREPPEAPGARTYAGVAGAGVSKTPSRVKFTHQRRRWTVAVQVSAVKLNGRRPSFKDMLGFTKNVLEIDIEKDVRYVNLHTLQPLLFIELKTEELAEEVGETLKKGVKWRENENDREIFGWRCDGNIRTVKVKNVSSNIGGEKIRDELSPFAEVLSVEKVRNPEYPNLLTGEWNVRVKDREGFTLPGFIRRQLNAYEDEDIWQLTWFGQADQGCYNCGQTGHIGRRCGEEERKDRWGRGGGGQGGRKDSVGRKDLWKERKELERKREAEEKARREEEARIIIEENMREEAKRLEEWEKNEKEEKERKRKEEEERERELELKRKEEEEELKRREIEKEQMDMDLGGEVLTSSLPSQDFSPLNLQEEEELESDKEVNPNPQCHFSQSENEEETETAERKLRKLRDRKLMGPPKGGPGKKVPVLAPELSDWAVEIELGDMKGKKKRTATGSASPRAIEKASRTASLNIFEVFRHQDSQEMRDQIRAARRQEEKEKRNEKEKQNFML